ncbi:MAG: response regulator, partial [Verrucomicrobiota bacterium]
MDPKPIKVLLIEDNLNDVVLLERLLQKSPRAKFELEIAKSLQSATARLTQGNINVILLDLSLGDSHGLETFVAVEAMVPEIPIIVLSGLDDETMALNAVHAGAQDYLVKGRVDTALLTRAMIYSIERAQAKADLLRAEEKYRSIFENAVEGIFQTTPEGRYLSANPALTRIYGYDSPDELISSLTNIGKTISLRYTTDQLLSAIYNECKRSVDCTLFTIALLDESTNELSFELDIREDIRLPSERIPVGRGLNSWVVNHHEPLLIGSTADEKRLGVTAVADTKPTQTWLGVPMIARDRVIGVISVESFKKNAFT